VELTMTINKPSKGAVSRKKTVAKHSLKKGVTTINHVIKPGDWNGWKSVAMFESTEAMLELHDKEFDLDMFPMFLNFFKRSIQIELSFASLESLRELRSKLETSLP
jgi:hypothetical protein